MSIKSKIFQVFKESVSKSLKEFIFIVLLLILSKLVRNYISFRLRVFLVKKFILRAREDLELSPKKREEQ